MRILDITTCSVADGKGFRLVVWCAGCEHHCEGCHNPESWDCNAGHKLTDKDIDIILDQLELDYIKGITFSGGDPLHPQNAEQVYKLCEVIKRNYPEKTIWVYTGYRFEDIWIPSGYWTTSDVNPTRDFGNMMLKYVDVFVDGQYVHNKRDITLAFRGSSNQRLIDVQKTLQKQKIVLYEE
jgi:anaerobic ribonucleoside-triphosphate reductase activating protein